MPGVRRGRRSPASAMTNCLDDPDSTPVDGRAMLAVRFLVDMVVCLSVVLGNSFIITAILFFRQKSSTALIRVSHVSNRFVLNLAIADLLVGLCALYCLTPYYLCSVARVLDQYELLCVLRFVPPIFSAMTSISSLGAISIDRYVAIVHSLRYRAFMSQRRATAIVAVPWLFSLAASSSLIYWNHYRQGEPCDDQIVPVAFVLVIGVPHAFLVFILVALVHFRIRREVIASQDRRRSMESAYTVSTSTASPFDSHEDTRKSAKVLVLVVGCFFVTYTPMCVLFSTRMVGLRGEVLNLVFEWSFTLANVNSLLNPFIYSWKNTTVRSAILRLAKHYRDHSIFKRGLNG